MNTLIKCAAAAAIALPLLASTASAQGNNNRKSNYYITNINATLLYQTDFTFEDADYDSERLRTDDIISAILFDLDLDLDSRRCDLVLCLDDDEIITNDSFWIFCKGRRGDPDTKVNVDEFVALETTEGETTVVKRKFTAKGDNYKARFESSFVSLFVDTGAIGVFGTLQMTLDLTFKGLNAIPFLNNAKFRTTQGFHAGDAIGLGDVNGEIDFKAKGRVRNDDFDEALDLTDIPAG